jgi:uncharacterized protein
MPTALITGASSGIGLELARRVARDRVDLILVARSAEKLEEIAQNLGQQHGVRADVIVSDLSQPESPKNVFTEVGRRGLAVDYLVNNAGFGLSGRFVELPLDRQLEMIRVNIEAVTHMTRLFLPAMIERGSGRILNVASTAAFQPGPLMAVYYASKAYVLSFSEAIAEEVAQQGISVTALCAGSTDTNFSRVANPQTTRTSRNPIRLRVEDVADYGYRAMLAGQRVAIPGFIHKILAIGNRFVPRIVSTKLTRKAQEKLKGVK